MVDADARLAEIEEMVIRWMAVDDGRRSTIPATPDDVLWLLAVLKEQADRIERLQREAIETVARDGDESDPLFRASPHEHVWDEETDEFCTYRPDPAYDGPWVIHSCCELGCHALKITRPMFGQGTQTIVYEPPRCPDCGLPGAWFCWCGERESREVAESVERHRRLMDRNTGADRRAD